MYATDAQVRACHHTKVMARLMTGWEYTAAEGGKKHLDFLKYTLDHMQGSTHEFLRDLMEALRYGFACVEIIWGRYESGPWAGYLGVKALKAKPPHGIQLRVDRFGNMLRWGVVQKVTGKERKYPTDKFIVYSYQKEPTGYYGRSDLQPVYRPYFIKKALEKWWGAHLEKFASPTAVGKYPPGSAQTEKKEVLDFLRRMQGNSAVIIPEKWEVELLEVGTGGSDAFLKALSYFNKMIARGILVPDLIQDQGDRSGSYSLGQVHASNFIWVLEGIGRELETVVREQLVRRIIDVNFSDVEEYPKFRFMGYKPADERSVADMFLALVDGQIVSPEDPIIRERLNLPSEGAGLPKKEPKPDPIAALGVPGEEKLREPTDDKTGVEPKPKDNRATTTHSDDWCGSSGLGDGQAKPTQAFVSTVIHGHAHSIVLDDLGNGIALPILHQHKIANGVVMPVNGHTHDLQTGFSATGASNGHAHPVIGDKAVAVDHGHQVVASRVWPDLNHGHEIMDPVPLSVVENSIPKSGEEGIGEGEEDGPKPPDRWIPVNQGSGTSKQSDLPDPVTGPVVELVEEEFRICREQFLGQLDKKEVLASGDPKRFEEIRVRQLGRFKETLAEVLAENVFRGAAHALQGAEKDRDEVYALPDGERPPMGLSEAMVETYGDLTPLFSGKLGGINEAAYALAGTMNAMVQGGVLAGKLGMASGKPEEAVRESISVALKDPCWKTEACASIDSASTTLMGFGGDVVLEWIGR
jgi:hypothetical protein